MKPPSQSLSAMLKERRIIPRWRTPLEAIEHCALEPERRAKRIAYARNWTKRIASIYEQDNSPFSANDLVAVVDLFSTIDVVAPSTIASARRVRKLLMENKPTAFLLSAIPAESPEAISRNPDQHRSHSAVEISRLRAILRDDTERPLIWSELSRHYTTVGENRKAIMAMQCALHRSSKSRYLCRVATRLFVHVSEPDRALSLLQKNPNLQDDPWLIAAEIATSSHIGKNSRYIKIGEELVAASIVANNQISELAAAIGTIELTQGSIKKAKNLFRLSLQAPTENSLAQAQWAFEQDSKIAIPTAAWQTPAAYEAQALAFRQAHKWRQAVEACRQWLAVEPFSWRPAVLGSYLGFHPDQSPLAEQFATAGLTAAPTDLMLLNNRAVARAYQGKLLEAFADVKMALSQIQGREYPHLLATLGLIAFRAGYIDLGTSCYASSVSWFVGLKRQESAASAALHYGRELARIGSKDADAVGKFAKSVLSSALISNMPELKGYADYLLEQLASSETHQLVEPQSILLDDIQQEASLMGDHNLVRMKKPKLESIQLHSAKWVGLVKP